MLLWIKSTIAPHKPGLLHEAFFSTEHQQAKAPVRVGKGGGGKVQHQDQSRHYCPRCYEYSASGTDKEIICAQCAYRGAPLPYTAEQLERARAWAEELGKHFGWE